MVYINTCLIKVDSVYLNLNLTPIFYHKQYAHEYYF